MFLFTNNCYYRKNLNRVQRKTTFILNTISEADELIYTVCIYTICMYLYRKLSTEIHNSTSYQKIRKLLQSFIKPICSTTCSINYSVGVKLLVRLRLGFGHFDEQKFWYNFCDTLSPLRSCKLELETTSHYFLSYDKFSSAHLAVMSFDLIDLNIFQLN